MPVLDKSRNEAPRRGPGESASPAAAADARDSFRGSLVEIETRVLDEVSASLETKHTTTGSPADSVAVTSNGSDDSAARSAARPASAKSASPTTAADAEGTSSPPSPKPTDSPQIPEGAKIRKGSKPDPQSRTETQGKGAPPKDSATKSAGGSKAPAPTNRKPSSMSPTDPASATTSKPSTPDTMSPPPPKETAKQKGSRSPPIKYELQLYRDLPDVTAEATSTFDVIDQCIYSSKWIGDSGQDTEFMPCECKPDFGGFPGGFLRGRGGC